MFFFFFFVVFGVFFWVWHRFFEWLKILVHALGLEPPKALLQLVALRDVVGLKAVYQRSWAEGGRCNARTGSPCLEAK